MKRLTSYWLSPFQFLDATRSEIRRRLNDRTEEFLQLIAQACGQYIEEVKADVSRRAMNEWREDIERIGRAAAGIAVAMRALDRDCVRVLDQGYVLETQRPDSRETTLARLDELVRVCTRVAAFRGLNPREGAPADIDRRRLTLACADAYRRVTGRDPKCSPNGAFARLLLIVEHAVGATPRAQTSIGAAYLKSILPPATRNLTRRNRR